MYRLFKIILISSVCWILTNPTVMGDDKDEIVNQQDVLNELESKIDAGNKKLDGLIESEKKKQRDIARFDQKISGNTTVISRLTRELKAIQGDISGARDSISNNQEHLQRTKRRYLGNIRQFYYSSCQSEPEFVDKPNVSVGVNRQVVYLTSVAGYESGNVTLAELLLEESTEHLDLLSGQKKDVTKLKQSKLTSTSLERSKKEKREKEIRRIKILQAEESDNIATLETAAAEMQEILKRLERQIDERRRDRGESIFATLKGQLYSPFKGKVITTFGKHTHPVTNLKSNSPGISIKGKAGRPVMAVASGTVAYKGKLRGYGNFTIINHDDQYFTTYANLGSIVVSEGQYLQSGAKIGSSGADGIVKFELRNGREPLDPIEWIKIDSF